MTVEVYPKSQETSDMAYPSRPGRSRLRVVLALVLAAAAVICALQFAGMPWRPAGIVKKVTDAPSPETDREKMSAPVQPSDHSPQPGVTGEETWIKVPTVDAVSDLETLPTSAAELLAECDQVMDALTTTFPDLPDVYEVAARFSNWRGDSTTAEKHWQKCLELDPNYGHAYYGLGKVAVKKGDAEESVRLLRRALDLIPNVRQVEIDLAQALMNSDRTAEAIAMLEKRRETNVLPAEACCLLGQAYLQQKDYEKARQAYQTAVDTYPEYAEGYYGLTTSLTRLGQTAKSAEYLRKFRELKSKFMEARTAERNEFEDLPAMCEDIASIYTSVGRIYFVRGKTTDAEKIWRRAAALHPSNIECRQSLAWLYHETGKIEKAIETLQQLADIASDKATYLLEIGRLRAWQGQFDAAERAFRSVSSIAPESPAGYSALAELYIRSRRKLPEAIELARKAAQLDSTATAYLLLSEACKTGGQDTEAAAAKKKAEELQTQRTDRRGPIHPSISN